DVFASCLVLDRLRVVEGVATIFQVAGMARLPELLVRHALHEAFEYGAVEALRVGDDAAQIEVHDGYPLRRLAGAEAILNEGDERGEVGAVSLEEVDESPLVDGNEARLLRRAPASRVAA